ncbi:hypothetical protein [Actinoplanes sp. NBRC 103695]|uniref:hypothetical protein n=1 Tax=Actinoplanes sp. NBRC 103695 TaxID=3032202 RepID=UPI00249FB4F7|nr:hypothetical protein [Actinoplanes sp. NBRC 103695]GLY95842.1 hypothetical protein Acsp02_30970 [Actinoplanes sp. NBRC 103695]
MPWRSSAARPDLLLTLLPAAAAVIRFTLLALERPAWHLIAELRRTGVSHISSGHFDCDRLVFLRREDLICAVLLE